MSDGSSGELGTAALGVWPAASAKAAIQAATRRRKRRFTDVSRNASVAREVRPSRGRAVPPSTGNRRDARRVMFYGMPNRARLIDLGRRRYAPVLELQRALHSAVAEGREPDTWLVVEHDPVITLGRNAKETNLLPSRPLLAARGVDVAEIERGEQRAREQQVCLFG